MVKEYLAHAEANYPVYLATEWGPHLPVAIAMTLHALRVSYEVRKMLNINGRLPMLHEVFVLLTLSFGGGIISASLLGNPQPWLVNNGMIPTYGLVYLAVGFFPGDFVFQLLRLLSPASDIFLAAVDGAIRGYGVTVAGVEMVRNMDGPISQSLTAMLVIGTVLGCGGGIIEDVIQMSKRSWALRTPTFFQRPNVDMGITFTTVVFYIFSTRLWRFDDQHPGLIGAAWLDAIIEWMIPELAPETARVLCGLFCAGALSYKALGDHRQYQGWLKKSALTPTPTVAAAPELNEKEDTKKDQ
ncbi:hypothetical protein H4R33_003403 [Dimargaris cristalligena]|uniref:Uncharacterized protein n=1 Tax=Dimargaris cristalligena TaxID=215637 RepID=A0A4P9ZU61_9FUNG|nr:hypothetical protein H4R33_003403 [Dimargaris cristalligena]RKP36120.1 hypothetical protein BJ085DRAFT_37851 [Dimargaris cristalligena]|eukprot:RKP36120.1 hypothetical protein BJ085DRAFT_37851 [Dimargaris cristalligena]